MKTFSISGTFKMGLVKTQPFSRKVEAKDKDSAKEKVLSLIGSQHKCPRQFIAIDKIEESK